MKSERQDRPLTILVVDDDAEVRAVLRKGFEQDGFQVLEAAGGDELLSLFESHPLDMITLDLTLGRDDGLALARRVRSVRNIPIVMITGKGDVVDRIVGLELGADDYIAKPFHMREVIARVRAVFRRYEASHTPLHAGVGDRLEFLGWTVDLSKRELTDATNAVCPLTTAEFNLLAILVRRPSRVFTRDELMDGLKGHE